MSYIFHLNQKKNKNPKVTMLLRQIQTLLASCGNVDDQKAYDALILNMQPVIVAAKKLLVSPDITFSDELEAILKDAPLTHKTVWGGVVYKFVDVKNNKIKKLLVVKAGGVLGFEYHKKKLEKLRVMEGSCLLFSSKHNKQGWKKGNVNVRFATVGATVTLQPGDEHGIVALSNCILRETSTNHLDDLEYVFSSPQLLDK